uniref:Ribonuclease H1 N-terminal domain-containing protein n=1 Tax=Lactuca sativa TaxID=4236 RepID=A0A9R1UQR4_LACSA|nr:hypothetical protein LSAT_V11C800398640 [Lactuca sativa]
MNQIQQQLKQKQEQKASLMKQLEVVNRELEVVNQISSDDSPPHTIPKIEKQPLTSNPEEYPLQADHKNIKKRYVIFNGENKGIYNDWGITNSYILGKNVIHKSYKTINEAEAVYNEAYKAVIKDNAECSKTVLLAPQKPISISTTQKPVSIPKSLNQLHAKIALEAIPSNKEKEAMKKPTTQKFAKLWDSLVSYTKDHYLMGFYRADPRGRASWATAPGLAKSRGP